MARKFIKAPELLSFVDAKVHQHYSFFRLKIFLILNCCDSNYIQSISQEEIYPWCSQCFIESTVNALQTPMINASMVICLLSASWCAFLPSFPVFSHIVSLRFSATGILGESTTLLVGLVELQNLWRKVWLIRAVKYFTAQM